jgi:hypothetical protein
MLLDWVIAPILSMLSTVIGVLPTADTGRFGGYGETYTPGLHANWTSWIHNAAYLLPMPIIVDCLLFLLTLFLPAVFVFQLAQWGYRELPHIMGNGS